MRFTRSLLSLLALLLSAASVEARWDSAFTIRKKITLDTSNTGTGITEPIGPATVLIRLHDGVFQFESAKEDGSDLRFLAADDKTLLPYHIEKYDPLLHEALVWVKLPEIVANGKTELWLYYGNPAAERVGDPKTSYDPETLLVYHFAEQNANPSDATTQANNAQNGAPTVGTLIGYGIRLGLPEPVTIPAGPSLPWGEGAAFTVSAWVKLTALDPQAVLFSRRENGRAFRIGADAGVPFVAVDEQRAAAGAPLSMNDWHYLAVTSEPGKITLYVDGEPSATLAASVPALNSALRLGAEPGAGETSAKGELDELQISRGARPAGWFKFAAISQAGEKAAKLVVFAEDEKGGGNILGDGYFAIILRNLTGDGWAVIGILAVMAVVTWIVVVRKALYLRQIGLGNVRFFSEWRRHSTNLESIEEDPALFGKTLDSHERATLQKSPLFAVFKIGIDEIAQRSALRIGQEKSIDSRSIQAIKAELDSGLVLETERLNSGIVLLTIAISGGPFLGLLGTVVGVMITFAAVAAAGEVNVNAIAPGIAAALLATVAGLAVAIPALFAYNYLLTRIKAATRDLVVFTDSFISKIAEQYPGGR